MTTDTTLIFSKDNPCSTTIYLEGKESSPVYTVQSEDEGGGKNMQTSVYDGTGQKLARLEWHDVGTDVVYRGDMMKGEKMSSWMSKSLIPFANSRTFKDDLGRKYKWHGCEAGGKMRLTADDTGKVVQAGFEKTHVSAPDVKAKLTLAPRAVELQDLVVISFLFLEKERRIQETASGTRADAEGTTASLGLGAAVVKGGI